MKVKELIKKYPNYKVVEMGYPGCIPFTCLPSELNGLHGKAYEKVFMELEVKGYEATYHPHTDIDITHLIIGGKKRPNPSYEGVLEIYLKGDKRLW